MSDEVVLGGRVYISSKRASEISAYAQDYIGQLARKGLIDAARIGGLWFISLESLNAYKSTVETFKPQLPKHEPIQEPDSLISFDGKDYISAARAAKVTGYHQDYVGQLARSGTILSRQVGNRWYVEREGIEAHKSEKDALLAAVQAESVGVHLSAHSAEASALPREIDTEPYFSYGADNRELMPLVTEMHHKAARENESEQPSSFEVNPVPIRIVQPQEIFHHTESVKPVKYAVTPPRKTIFYGKLSAAALTIVIVLSFGISMLKDHARYAAAAGGASHAVQTISNTALAVEAADAFQRFGDILEALLVPELRYTSSN